MPKILGIDEAGRGPVIGPMVMCGYMIESSKKSVLKRIGVRDSKLLSSRKRESLFGALKEHAAGYQVVSISAREIDLLRNETNLNKIEIEKMKLMINSMKPDVAIIDAPEANTKQFAKKIASGLSCECRVVAENFADRKYPEVGAASIIAKVTRDKEIEQLARSHGEIGSGYPSDPVTMEFLKNWLKRNKEFPDFVRKSWMTAQVMKREKEQTRLGKFAM